MSAIAMACAVAGRQLKTFLLQEAGADRLVAVYFLYDVGQEVGDGDNAYLFGSFFEGDGVGDDEFGEG